MQTLATRTDVLYLCSHRHEGILFFSRYQLDAFRDHLPAFLRGLKLGWCFDLDNIFLWLLDDGCRRQLGRSLLDGLLRNLRLRFDGF